MKKSHLLADFTKEVIAIHFAKDPKSIWVNFKVTSNKGGGFFGSCELMKIEYAVKNGWIFG